MEMEKRRGEKRRDETRGEGNEEFWGGDGACGPSARAGNEMSCEESDLTQVPRYHALRVTESGGREAEGERGKLARKGKA
jgi:hypothetical protein